MRFVHIAPDGAGYLRRRVAFRRRAKLASDKLEWGDADGGLSRGLRPVRATWTAMATLQQSREKGKAGVIESVNGISTGQTL
jgi:hypothetical protein